MAGLNPGEMQWYVNRALINADNTAKYGGSTLQAAYDYLTNPALGGMYQDDARDFLAAEINKASGYRLSQAGERSLGMAIGGAVNAATLRPFNAEGATGGAPLTATLDDTMPELTNWWETGDMYRRSSPDMINQVQAPAAANRFASIVDKVQQAGVGTAAQNTARMNAIRSLANQTFGSYLRSDLNSAFQRGAAPAVDQWPTFWNEWAAQRPRIVR